MTARHWIFLTMGFAIVLPLVVPLGLPTEPSPPVKANYYTVEELPEGATVFVSVDVDPASQPELDPYFRASVRQLKRKQAKLVFATLWYQAPPLVERWIAESVEPATFPGDRVYHKNVDYVWLGFREGKQAVMANMGQDLWATFSGRTADGTPLTEIPWMAPFHKLADFPLLVLVSAGFPGAKEYVQQVQARYHLRMVAACTAVSTTDLSPYYASGQLLGLAGGMGATAEYEVMVSRLIGIDPRSGLGAKSLDVLNIGHLVIILAIVLGNVVYLVGRRKS